MANWVAGFAVLLALTGCATVADRLEAEYDPGGRQQRLANEKFEREARQAREDRDAYLALIEHKERELDELVAETERTEVRDDASLKALGRRWRDRLGELLASIPWQAKRGPSKGARGRDRELQEETRPPVKERYDAFEARLQAAKRPMRLSLVRRGIAADATLSARTLLFSAYVSEVNTPDPELTSLARTLAARHDARLLAAFRQHGGYGKQGPTTNDVMCVFSSDPWPDPLAGTAPVEQRFRTHFVGAEVVVHVLARLPRRAAAYGQPGAELHLQLLSDVHGQIDVAEDVLVGSPAGLGDARFVQASFRLPPPRFDHARYWFDARAVLVTGSGRRVLTQSSFSWAAAE